MQRQALVYVLGFLLALIPIITHATSCRDVTNTINEDIIKYASSLPNQLLPWMNLSWLQEQLGTVNAKETTTNQVEYVWHCENDAGYLIAATDKNGNLVNIKGEYASNDGSGLFSTPISPNHPQHEFNQAIETIKTAPSTLPITEIGQIQAQADAKALAIKLNNYNEYFKSSLQTQEQLTTDISSKIKTYYLNLRQCIPGTYQYATPILQNLLFNTSIIHHQQEGLCIVETTYDIPEIGKVVLKCKYQPESLQLFTDEEAKVAALGDTSFDNDHPSALQKVTNSECRRYINGSL